VCYRVLQSAAEFCSVLQCVAVCCSAAMRFSVLQAPSLETIPVVVAACCSDLAVHCSVLQCAAVCPLFTSTIIPMLSVLQCDVACCIVL